MRTTLAIVTILCLAIPALAETFTEDFESGSNVGGWTFMNSNQGINPTGGNPGGWFYDIDHIIFAPIFRCESDAAMFSGDYTSLGVNRISGDFQTLGCGNSGAHSYAFTLLLRDEGGTPGFTDDDVYVYVDPFQHNIPWIDEGWVHYDFDIPSDWTGAAGELPEGWMGGSYRSGADVFPPDRTFQDVMSNVSRVEFFWIHPAWYALITPWAAGADNITIEWDEGIVSTESASLGSVKALYR